MIKYYCDRCGHVMKRPWSMISVDGRLQDLCMECTAEVRTWIGEDGEDPFLYCEDDPRAREQ